MGFCEKKVVRAAELHDARCVRIDDDLPEGVGLIWSVMRVDGQVVRLAADPRDRRLDLPQPLASG